MILDVTVGLVETLMLVPEEAGASATLPNQIEICAQISGGVLQSSLTFLLSVTSDVARGNLYKTQVHLFFSVMHTSVS